MAVPQPDFRDTLTTIGATGERQWLFPRKPSGRLYSYRKALSYAFLAMLFVGPWVRLPNGLPLLLFNVIERKFIILGSIFWPQDFFILLIALLTFIVFVSLFTVVYGRVFCGWVCPQTIFLEMVFRRVEYWFEGDGSAQKALARADWTWDKIWRKTGKQTVFGMLSFLIANTFLAYIIGSDALVKLVTEPPAQHLGGLGAMIIFTGVFWWVFAWFREQVCTIACPYGRLQSVLLTKDSLVVAYDYQRGEPREKVHKGQERPFGDCIDCHQCVQVCPMGIDIRNGTQLECTNCTACIDACNHIMEQVDLPKGLIRVDSENHIAERTAWRLTGRIRAYSAVLLLMIVGLTTLLATRPNVAATILRTPGQLYQKTARGTVTNLYNVSVINKTDAVQTIELRVLSPSGGHITLVGQSQLTLPAQGIVEGVFFAELPNRTLTQMSTPIVIGIFSGNQLLTKTKTKFLAPDV
jgi:cytochrome c oxidase accessory protein FixG